MKRSIFSISKMDCASEEQIVRMALAGVAGIKGLDFDLSDRRLIVYHDGDSQGVVQKLESLDLGAKLDESVETDVVDISDHSAERRVLTIVLLINLFFFGLEIITGLIAGSMGLVADSLDMLADCLVFGLSLFVVGSTLAKKKRVARVSGYFQLLLATLGLVEVVRRFLGFGEVPEYRLMMIIAALALIGNSASIYLLRKARREEAHMQASYIFLSNDVIINFGVILAGLFVLLTTSKLPDLFVGTAIFIIVARGAFHILKLGRPDSNEMDARLDAA